MPIPHEALQPSQGAQSYHSQSTGHGFIAQLLSSLRLLGAGHANPRPCAGMRIVLDLFERPPPHVPEQLPHSVHSSSSQSTQALEHATFSYKSPQVRPRKFGFTRTLRLLICVPLQKGAHSDHGDHSVMLQSIGQGSRLHSSVCTGSPLQFTPAPMCGTSIPLNLFFLPESHDGEQSVQAVHSDHLQS